MDRLDDRLLRADRHDVGTAEVIVVAEIMGAEIIKEIEELAEGDGAFAL